MTPRLAAYVSLLAKPDPPDLMAPGRIGRGSVVTVEGKPERFQDRSALLQRWLMNRDLEVHGDYPCSKPRKAWRLTLRRRA